MNKKINKSMGLVEFIETFSDIKLTPLQKAIAKKFTITKTAKQKKRPGAILRWFRRLWCKIKGIHYVEVHGMGRGTKDEGVRFRSVIIDDLEEEEDNE